ncbi:MAG: lipid A deacylase LpxR family protein [Akkermansiaceae bacterium]
MTTFSFKPFAASILMTAATSQLMLADNGDELLGQGATAGSVAEDSSYLTFFLDNDLFAGTDENYTNGARISYITEGMPLFDFPWLDKYLHKFSGDGDGKSPAQRIWGFEDPSLVEYSYGFAITQLMFTPGDLDALTAPPGERPYAGWSSIGFSLHARDERAVNTVELSIGVVGPHSQAQETQDFIHDLRGFDKFQGWDSQIPNEVTLNLHFQQKRRWTDLNKLRLPFDLEIDGFFETGYSLGNYLTEAHIGALFRLGWNIPVEFSDARLTPTAHTQRLFTGDNSNAHKWSCYVMGGARATGVLHDITIDGPVFRDFDTGIESEPLVGEIYAGFGVRYDDWEFNYVHTYRTKEFKSQRDDQSFGSIAIRKRF